MSDQISHKICIRCQNIILRMLKFRQGALKRDQWLKDTFNALSTKTFDGSTSKRKQASYGTYKQRLGQSIEQIMRQYPSVKIPKKCLTQNFSIKVLLDPGEIGSYFLRNSKNQKACESLNASTRQYAKKRLSSDFERPLSMDNTPKRKKLTLSNNTTNLQGNSCTQKYRKLLICQICEQFFNTQFEWELHRAEHMYCKSCNLKFSSPKAKEKHTIANLCPARNKTEVSLERIDKNVQIRQTYHSAFKDFGRPIANDEVVSDNEEENDVIVSKVVQLSEEEEEDTSFSESISNKNERNLLPCNVMRPEIVLNKKKHMIDSLPTSANQDQVVMKKLLRFENPTNPITLEAKTTQTDLPDNKDIHVDKKYGTCCLKNLGEWPGTYIPVYLSKGEFDVQFSFEREEPAVKSKNIDDFNKCRIIDSENVVTEIKFWCRMDSRNISNGNVTKQKKSSIQATSIVNTPATPVPKTSSMFDVRSPATSLLINFLENHMENTNTLQLSTKSSVTTSSNTQFTSNLPTPTSNYTPLASNMQPTISSSTNQNYPIIMHQHLNYLNKTQATTNPSCNLQVPIEPNGSFISPSSVVHHRPMLPPTGPQNSTQLRPVILNSSVNRFINYNNLRPVALQRIPVRFKKPNLVNPSTAEVDRRTASSHPPETLSTRASTHQLIYQQSQMNKQPNQSQINRIYPDCNRLLNVPYPIPVNRIPNVNNTVTVTTTTTTTANELPRPVVRGTLKVRNIRDMQ